MAPELIGSNPKYSRESDIFAYGVVLWELVTRTIPFDNVKEEQLIEGIKRGDREEISSKRLLEEIIKGC